MTSSPRSALPLLAALALALAGCPDDEGPGRFGQGDDDSADDDDATHDPDEDGDGHPASVDCDDEDPMVHPGAPELCDELDNDCDEAIDEEPLANLNWYRDDDGDGYGVDDDFVTGCIGPDGHVLIAGDCDDGNPAIHPGALIDGIDADCDGRLEWRVEITLSVVQSYELCLDHEDDILGWGSDWETADTYSVWLDSGLHTVGFRGVGVEWDEDEGELTGAIVVIALTDDTQWWSNTTWKHDPDPTLGDEHREGWCTPGFDDSEWGSTWDFGQWGSPPWGPTPPEMAGTPASWIWDAAPIQHRTQYFRYDFELP
jgi:hypothetical protein